MTILSFYIQHNDCFVALGLKGKTIEKYFTLGQMETQAMVLVPFIQETWKKAGKPEVTCLMAPRGPGSFTSLRVGLAAAQGLELAFPKAKIFSPTHFDVLAYAAGQKTLKSFIVLIDSKKGDFYGQLFNQSSSQKPKIYTNETLEILLKDNPDMQVITDFYFLDRHAELKVTEEIRHLEERMLRGNLGILPLIEDRLIINDKNLATCQIELYEKDMKLRKNPEYQKFQPFYLYLPEYVKQKPV